MAAAGPSHIAHQALIVGLIAASQPFQAHNHRPQCEGGEGMLEAEGVVVGADVPEGLGCLGHPQARASEIVWRELAWEAVELRCHAVQDPGLDIVEMPALPPEG